MMSGLSHHETSMQSIPSVSGGLSAKEASFHELPRDASMHPILMVAERNGDSSAMHLLSSTGICQHQVSDNHVNLLSASPRMLCAVPAWHMQGGVSLLLASTETGKGISQNLASCKHLSNGEHCTVSQSHSAATVTTPAFDSKFHGALSRCEATAQHAMCNQIRKARISKGVKELEELVPNSGKGSGESVLDDVIEYVKFLKLQVLLLSQSRLGSEATPNPFIHLEALQGYGHYLIHEQMVGEPLEEIIGQLMEKNTPVANQLLERKGLYVIPMALAHDALQTD
ncbi:transcription factor LRL2-like isoform X4 [Magnolia sinica]|uniref:transcription factor LRL2-like isoform X4 n=1 Tax=Magnolia sinica TaxID=86752 RepID=UPI002659AF72|nr:transcription factor LRL2-like isoform X4 [Magnolia sinica]